MTSPASKEIDVDGAVFNIQEAIYWMSTSEAAFETNDSLKRDVTAVLEKALDRLGATADGRAPGAR